MMQFLSLIEGGTWPGLGFKKINFFQRLFFMMRDVADVVVVVVVVFEVSYNRMVFFFLKHKFLGNVSEVCTSLHEYGFV